MFVQEAMVPVGASFGFSIDLGEGLRPIQGTGEVIWLSRNADRASSGMGVQFLKLEDESVSLVREVVAERLRKSLAASEWR